MQYLVPESIINYISGKLDDKVPATTMSAVIEKLTQQAVPEEYVAVVRALKQAPHKLQQVIDALNGVPAPKPAAIPEPEPEQVVFVAQPVENPKKQSETKQKK